jgi:hypothetical protein
MRKGGLDFTARSRKVIIASRMYRDMSASARLRLQVAKCYVGKKSRGTMPKHKDGSGCRKTPNWPPTNFKISFPWRIIVHLPSSKASRRSRLVPFLLCCSTESVARANSTWVAYSPFLHNLVRRAQHRNAIQAGLDTLKALK